VSGHEQPSLSPEERGAIKAAMEGASGSELLVFMRRDARQDRLAFEQATAARSEFFSRLRLPKGTDTVGSGKPKGGS
jgi:hypothetical protein